MLCFAFAQGFVLVYHNRNDMLVWSLWSDILVTLDQFLLLD